MWMILYNGDQAKSLVVHQMYVEGKASA